MSAGVTLQILDSSRIILKSCFKLIVVHAASPSEGTYYLEKLGCFSTKLPELLLEQEQMTADTCRDAAVQKGRNLDRDFIKSVLKVY